MNIVIREAKPSDAEQLIAFVQRLSEEPGIDIELSAGEFTLTTAEEQKILADSVLSENSVYLLAETDGRIIGVAICNGRNRKAARHMTILGISVDRSWRGKGIGRQLMAKVIERARSTGVVSRIELFVFARNKRAIHLYQEFGFEIEGCRRKAIFKDGEYLDDLVMALLL